MKTLHVETIPRRMIQLWMAFVLAACAVGVEPGPEVSREEPALGVSRADLSAEGNGTPKCQEDEVLCCPNGGPRCVCLPAGHTCTSGPVWSPPVFKLAP